MAFNVPCQSCCFLFAPIACNVHCQSCCFLFVPIALNEHCPSCFLFAPIAVKMYTFRELLFSVCAYGFQCALSQMCVSKYAEVLFLVCIHWFHYALSQMCVSCFHHCFQCALSQMHVANEHPLPSIRNIRNVCFLFTPIDLHAYVVLSEMHIILYM
jgi:hypothetical protein